MLMSPLPQFEIWAGGAGVVDRWGFDSPVKAGDEYYVYDPDPAGKVKIVGKGQAGSKPRVEVYYSTS